MKIEVYAANFFNRLLSVIRILISVFPLERSSFGLICQSFASSWSSFKVVFVNLGIVAIPQRATKIASSVSETRNTSFDNLGRLLAHQQITDGTTYSTAYSYNLSGALIEQTYPSVRVVKNTPDADGGLAQVQSKKNANGFFTYADAFSYNSTGAITKMQLGNGRWETFKYNEREQITQIGLGTTDTNVNPNLLKLEFGYGTLTQNNGSMREQKVTVPAVGANPTFTATQTYTYDDLNRIKSAAETVGGSQTWKQTFETDRYGNREFDAANTTTIGSCATAVCNPNINTSDNRFSSGQGYSYDANGNVTQDATNQRFTYDAENHQKEFFAASNPGSTPDATYHYDGDGRRVKKVSQTETTVFVYDAGGTVIAGGDGADIGSFEAQTAPTPPATVSGRVFTPSGLALRNAIVALIDPQGVGRTVVTSSFGVFLFQNVSTSQTYILTVSSKRYRFSARTLEINGDMINVHFIGLE